MHEWDREDLVCLHLSAYDDAEGTPVPRAVTATGIGDALAVGDSAASRLDLLDDLASLEAGGLVRAEQRSVEGYDDPRTAYVLTPEGRDRAAAVREAVSGETVRVAAEDTEEVPLEEIDRYFEDEPAPLVAALARATEDGRVRVAAPDGNAFVGREDQLDTVRRAIEESFNREGRTVAVAGAAGTGKTALVREAIDRVAEDRDELVAATGASTAGTTDPYTAIRQAFEAIPGGAELSGLLEDAAASHTPEDPGANAARRTALFDDIADGLRDAASDHPVVLSLDNLQWADGATLELFAHLATTVDELIYPVAFVATYRTPAVAGGEHPLEDALDRVDREGTLRRVTLGPLDRTETRALLAGEFGRSGLPEPFVDIVHDLTGGNPLFVRETATHLLETGQVDPEADDYPTDPEAVDVPGEVADGIAARISRLDDATRDLLRLGAVVGERLPREVLTAASDLPPAERREYVDVLVASGIWTPVGGETSPAESGPPADGEVLRFVSGALREAVVDRMPDATASDYHERVAAALTAGHGEDASEAAARIAHHYEAAGADRRAVEYYRRAGDRAQDAYANEEALESYERALALARADGGLDDAELADIHHDIARVHGRMGDQDGAIATAEDGLDVAPESTRERCRLLGVLAGARRTLGDYDAATETARRQQELAADIGAGELEWAARNHRGWVAMERGSYDRAREHFERAREVARDAGDAVGQATVLKNLGSVAFYQGNDEEAREYYRHSLDLAEDAGHRAVRAKSLNNLGMVAHSQGEYDSAREYFERTLEIERELGNRHVQAGSLNNLGAIADERGAYDRAREYYERGLEMQREVGDRPGAARTLNNLGSIGRKCGAFDRAREHFERSLEIARDLGDRSGEASSLANLGALARSVRACEEAREHYEEAITIFRELGDPQGEAGCLIGLAAVAERRGHLDRASEHVARAAECVADLDAAADVARHRLVAGRVALARGDLCEADERASEARETYEEIGKSHQAALCRLLAGRVAAAREDPDAALEHWRAALETFEDVGAAQHALDALSELVALRRELGDADRVRELCRRARAVLSDAPEATVELHREWVRECADALED